jgi:hypothetical protein
LKFTIFLHCAKVFQRISVHIFSLIEKLSVVVVKGITTSSAREICRRLISSKPKLKTIGRLRHWDVEPSELETFVQILRKAKSLNLLHDITIV